MMKLFVIAAVAAVATAGRLEHLERSYLPPDYNSVNSARPSFGSHGGLNSFGGANSGAFGSSGAGLNSHNAGASFNGATSNQYLPPDHGPSASSEYAGSLTGFAQNYPTQHYSGNLAAPGQQYAIPSTQYGTPQGQYQQAQYSQQSATASRQYLAPGTSSFQSLPQQPFDERTGYHY